ncbi:hypothetical protein TWF694_002002 [Orbilia ellipsospora]|uniref:Uncharacterized protein n=1 Tax=Orbilia ellipsospora TaxID=2528407 RepID=A0AAV9X5H1_9PEZI
MTKYGLTLINRSTKPRHFFFFTAPPQVDNAGDGNIYVNTWLDTWAAPGGIVDVTTILEFFAWCGPSSQNRGKTTVSQGNPTQNPVTLGAGSQKGSSYQTNWDAKRQLFSWGDDLPNNANPGAYSIKTDTFRPSDNLNIGMAMKKNGLDYATPVAVIAADPNITYNISPVVQFFVAVGDNVTNDIFHYTATGVDSACYDFIGKGKNFVHGSVTYTDQGLWTPTEYDNNVPLTASGVVESFDLLSQDLVTIPPWLQAAIDFTVPIVAAAVREAAINAIRQALLQIHYEVGNFTFSSDGQRLILSYRLPFGGNANTSQAIILPPPHPRKAPSEISVSLDARNEILKISFSPQWYRIQELDSAESTDLVGYMESASLESLAVPRDVIAAVNAALNSIKNKLPPRESWTITDAKSA